MKFNIHKLMCKIGLHLYRAVRVDIDKHPYWKFDRYECVVCENTKPFEYY